MYPLCLPDACQAPPKLVARLQTLRVFFLCRCSPLRQGESGVAVPYWRKMQHLLLLLSPGEIPCLTQSFCIQGVSENSGQHLGVKKEKKQEHGRRFLHLLSTHFIPQLHLGEKLCFVISLASGLYAVEIFFLSSCFSLAREHQLCGQNKHKMLGNSWWLCLFLYASCME